MKVSKKIITFLILGLLIIQPISTKANEISVFYSGRKINYATDAQMINKELMVPLVDTVKTLGGFCEWNPETKEISVVNGENPLIVLKVGEKNAYKEGFENYTLTTPPVIINDTTFVSAQFIAEEFFVNIYTSKDKSSIKLDSRVKDGLYQDTMNNIKFQVVSGLEFSYASYRSPDMPIASILAIEPNESNEMPASMQEVFKLKSNKFNKNEYISYIDFSPKDKRNISIDYRNDQDGIYIGHIKFEQNGKNYDYKFYKYIKTENGFAYISSYMVDESRRNIDENEILNIIKTVAPLY